MGLRTPEQYKASLKDGREVYYRGELVQEVSTHPVIGVAVEHACIDYRLAEDARYRDLAVVTDPQSGERYSRYYHLPRNAEDLLQRSRLIAASTREGATLVVLIKEIGTDASSRSTSSPKSWPNAANHSTKSGSGSTMSYAVARTT